MQMHHSVCKNENSFIALSIRYLFVILATSTTTKIYYSDISATGIGTGNWYAEDSFTGVTQSVTSFDFGQNSS